MTEKLSQIPASIIIKCIAYEKQRIREHLYLTDKIKLLYLRLIPSGKTLYHITVLVFHRPATVEKGHTVFGIIIQMARPQGIVVLVHQLDYIPPEFRKIIVYAVDHLFAFQLRPVLDDTDIAQIYGRALDGDKVVEASQPSGLVYGSVEIESCLLYPSADFAAIVLATGYDSSTSVQRVQYATPEHFPQEPVWETVSANAEMQIYFSYYHEDGSYESFNPSYSGLLEKSADAAIYRMAYEPESDSEFVKAMEISGLMREGRGTVYLYLDATECDLTGSTAGNYITRIFPEESYTGFCTADSRPAYFATSKNSVSYFPVYSYDPEIVSISVSSNVTADIDGESRILLASINISYQLSGSASGLYTEQFYVKDRTPW